MQILYDVATGRIKALANGTYQGPEANIEAQEGFSATDIDHYQVQDGVLLAIVPQTVTPRQAKIALLQAGLLDEIETVIASIPDETTRRIAQVEWEYAQEFRRDWQLLNQLAEQAGISQDQIDELFIAAAQI